jgi:hypothetical protein
MLPFSTRTLTYSSPRYPQRPQSASFLTITAHHHRKIFLHRRSLALAVVADHRPSCSLLLTPLPTATTIFFSPAAPSHYPSDVMASTLSNSSSSSSSNTYVDFLEQAKRNFCLSNAHLSHEELNRAWFQAACQTSQPSMAHEVPRSMAFNASDMTQLPVWTTFGLLVPHLTHTRLPASSPWTVPARLLS